MTNKIENLMTDVIEVMAIRGATLVFMDEKESEARRAEALEFIEEELGKREPEDTLHDLVAKVTDNKIPNRHKVEDEATKEAHEFLKAHVVHVHIH